MHLLIATRNPDKLKEIRSVFAAPGPVSYKHLTLPTSDLV